MLYALPHVYKTTKNESGHINYCYYLNKFKLVFRLDLTFIIYCRACPKLIVDIDVIAHSWRWDPHGTAHHMYSIVTM